MKKQTLLFLFLFVLTSSALHAQWINFRPENTQGIGNVGVNDIIESTDHKLWFATHEGLWVHDQQSGNWEREAVGHNLDAGVFNCLFIDQQGYLWAGTKDSGALRRNPDGSWMVLGTDAGLSGNDIRGITQDVVGNLWFASYDGGLCRYDGSDFISYGSADGISDNAYLCAFCDSEGRLWFGTEEQGIVLRNFAGWNQYNVSDGIAGNTITHAMEDANHKIFLSGTHGLTTYYGGWWGVIGSGMGLMADSIYKTIMINDTTLCLATDLGVITYNYTSFSLESTADGLAENNTQSLYFAENETLWTGHPHLGISYNDGTGWKHFNTGSGLRSASVFDAMADGGKMYFATAKGLSIFDDGNWKTLGTSDGLPYEILRAVEPAPGGKLWLLTEAVIGKLMLETDTGWMLFDHNNGLLESTPLAICTGPDWKLWVAYANDSRISSFDGTDWTHYDFGINFNARDIKTDGFGSIWVAGDQGIFVLENLSQQYHFTTADGLPALNVTSLCIAADEKRYAACSDPWNGGIGVSDGVPWITISNGLHSSNLSGVLMDQQQRLWACSATEAEGNLISCRENNQWIYYGHNAGVGGSLMTRLYEEPNGNIWALSADGGVSLFNQNWAGLDENTNEESAVEVFPNPADQYFQITLPDDTEILNFQIYDLSGRKVSSDAIFDKSENPSSLKIDCRHYPQGFYLLKIETARECYCKKLVIRR